MKEYFVIEKKKLRKLLLDHITLIALSQGGVDNWEWYGASVYDFIESWQEEHPEVYGNNEDCYLSDIAEADLVDYPTVMEFLENLISKEE